MQNDRILWSKKLSGLCRFPVAVGDLDHDGLDEIVALTGFNEDPGQVYIFDFKGDIMPGWPISFNGHWMISSPALADMDGDDVPEIICGDLENGFGQVYVLKADGKSINNQWPIPLPNIPAVTPSIGDLDKDGSPDVIISSTREIYALDIEGDLINGWPYSNSSTKFSFQSPLLSDLDRDGYLEIIAESHGDAPLFLILNQDASDHSGWPKKVPGNRWTFHPPTLIFHKNQAYIIMARPLGDLEEDMLYVFDEEGNQYPHFPIVKSGGTEGLTTVVDIDNNGDPDLIFPSNMLDPNGEGFIHAYSIKEGVELPGFPLRMKGFTYLNGATFGDTDGDGLLEMAILTFTEYPDDTPDTSFLHLYDLDVPKDKEHVWWPTYKGDNLRNGLVPSPRTTNFILEDLKVQYNNPFSNELYVKNSLAQALQFEVLDFSGQVVIQGLLNPFDNAGLNSSSWPQGTYFLVYSNTQSQQIGVKRLILIR